MNLACSVEERDGITLVELDVSNPTRTARRIRIENALGGQVLPPRHHGTPVDGWDEEGVTVSVDAGGHRALGYACQAVPESPPAHIVGSEPTDSADSSARSSGTVLAALGDPRPPRDVVDPESRGVHPEREAVSEDQDMNTDREGLSGESDRRPAVIGPDETDCEADTTESSGVTAGHETDDPVSAEREATHAAEQSAIPPAIDAWLERKAEQIAAGEPGEPSVLTAVSRRAGELATRAKQ